MEHSLCFNFQTTNNWAEYEVLIVGLKLVKDLGVKSLIDKSDSQLVVNHVNEAYETNVPCLIKYLDKVKQLVG